VQGFKTGSHRSIDIAGKVMISAVLDGEARLRHRSSEWYLVPIPGHASGPAGRPLDLLCRYLAGTVPWLVYEPAQLIRTRTIRQSSTSTDRPTENEHLHSLELPSARMAQSVIIVDDVFTYGHVSNAVSLLLRDHGAVDVVVACLAQTRL
jgi:predicted amidophosphoribosyltransferase